MNTRGRRILSMVTAIIGNDDDSYTFNQGYDFRAATKETTRL